MVKNLVSLFAGGGLCTEGVKREGIVPTGAIEFDEKKAEIYKLNHGDQIDVVDILEVESWEKYKNCWMLQASPPCKNSSCRKVYENRSQKTLALAEDVQLAKAINRAIEEIRPRYFLLENVAGYKGTEAMHLIQETLTRLGYSFRRLDLNSVDFGVPQKRNRIFLLACLDYQILESLDLSPYYRPRVGWYAGIERHLGTCRQKTLAAYQVAAIQKAIAAGKISPNDVAVLVGGAGSNPKRPTVTNWASPSPTVRSCEGIRSGGWRPCIVYREDFYKPLGKAVGYKLSGRCLLALQGVPDSFAMANEIVTCFVAGNGVSVPVAQSIVKAILALEAS